MAPVVAQDPPDRRERRTAIALFFATLLSVYLVYGYTWAGGDPLSDPETAGQSAQFAVALMGILLAHEMGHYLVALRHGFRLSLPYFLPFPAAFGTFGAIIRLRSLPPSRTALLEMGAAGPLAGFVVAVLAIAIGLPGIVEHGAPELLWVPPPDPATLPPPSEFDRALEWLFSVPPLSWLAPAPAENTIPLLILANPLAMDLVGLALEGARPGRYAELSPIATAGWVGCLLTGINLLPIGQLDGGHILNALAPRHAARVARIGVYVALAASLLWSGWFVWAMLLLVLRAWVSLPVPERPGLTPRARLVAALAGVAFLLSFMPRPLEMENMPFSEIKWVDADGNPLAAPAGGPALQALDEEAR